MKRLIPGVWAGIVFGSMCGAIAWSRAPQPIQQPLIADSLFSTSSHPDLYWKAFMLMVKNNKKAAQKVIAALQTGDHAGLQLNQEKRAGVHDFLDDLFIATIVHDPQLLSQLGVFEALGVREHNAHLNQVSPQALQREYALKKDWFAKMDAYCQVPMTDEEKISHKIAQWLRSHTLASEPFLFHEYKINQMFGILFNLTVVFTQFHPLDTVQDVEHYLTRMGKIAGQLQQALELLEHQKKLGIVPPVFALEKVLGIIANSVPADVTQNIFYAHLASALQKLQLENADVYLHKAEQLLKKDIYPAYQALQNYCKQLLALTTVNHGVWSLPQGDAYYLHTLAQHTTTDLTPEQIHQLGLSEVAKIQHEMREILASVGVQDATKPVGVLVQEMAEDPKFYYPNTAQGRAQCIADYEAILERCRTELYPLFDIKPTSPVKVLPVPEHEQEGQPMAYYYGPSLTGERPGIFFANLRDMAEVPTFGMETLAVHEAEPGHHFQISLQQEMDIPVLRKLGEFNAYVEGWALYVEKLAYEQDFYSSSYAKLGHLQDELLRAVRLVVDTGLHHKRWTREQAIEYMQQATGYSYSSVVTEVERYLVLPGQACSYKIGQLKILELRQKAKDALGTKFDIREFHNVVLKVAACPLSVLEEVVDEYIKTKLKK